MQADETESKMIYIEKNSSLKTVKVTLENGEEYTANAARLKVMKKNSVEVPAGTYADIEIADSYPTVMFSGRFTFRLELSSRNWEKRRYPYLFSCQHSQTTLHLHVIGGQDHQGNLVQTRLVPRQTLSASALPYLQVWHSSHQNLHYKYRHK